ncbi:MAG TPA: hypothetical protein VG013_17780 [Gemmataceae bacterium]|jgi:hypothetical protein|nr:hypothetical protein [Gemmataceae bacterium]
MSTGPDPLFGSGQWYHPAGHYGAYPACGCSSLLIIIAGLLLVCAGLMGGCGGFFPSSSY